MNECPTIESLYLSVFAPELEEPLTSDYVTVSIGVRAGTFFQLRLTYFNTKL